LPNVGPYIYDVSISGFTRSSICIYDISSLRVNVIVFYIVRGAGTVNAWRKYYIYIFRNSVE